MSYPAIELQFSEFGEPANVIKQVKTNVNDPGDGQVLVKILAAPINPGDLVTIQGIYPVKPKFPAVGGNEFVGEVIKIGKNVTEFKPGDRVMAFMLGLGTWRTHALFKSEELMKIPNDIELVLASTLSLNPTLAYRMLKDFVTLKSGDTIIQNGANGGIAQAVIQLCKIWGIKNICVVRNRPDIEELRKQLKNLGASEVLTEEEFCTTKLFKDSVYSKAKLAINATGGKTVLEMIENLDQSGLLLTYGGKSPDPVSVPTLVLIFKDIRLRGFWVDKWIEENLKSSERQKMFNELFDYIKKGQFKGPIHNKLIPHEEFKTALDKIMNNKGFVGEKFILDFTKFN